MVWETSIWNVFPVISLKLVLTVLENVQINIIWMKVEMKFINKFKEFIKEPIDINPEKLCNAPNIYYKTTFFSKLYNSNEETMHQEFETSISVSEQIP
jgi:hypothetical protein